MSTRILLYVCRWDYEPCHCRHLGNSFSLQSLSWYSICCCFQVLCIASIISSYQIGKGKHFEFWSLISSTALQWLVTKHHSFFSFLTLERCRLSFFKSTALHSVIDLFPLVLFTMNLLSHLSMSSATRHNNVNTEKNPIWIQFWKSIIFEVSQF